MTQTYSEPRVVCRPALASDTSDVLEFTKTIWEGHDYIHEVWSEWLADPRGLLAVAQFGAHTVGMAKVTWLSQGQWWLEGLRVDPALQGQKIGSHLHEYMDAWWLGHGDGVIRLMTNSKRVQVHHLCERTGFAKVGEVTGYRLAAAAAPAHHRFEPVKEAEASEALRFAGKHLDHSGGLMDSGWRFSVPDETMLADWARAGRLHWWRGHEGLLGASEDEDENGPVLGIGFAACEMLALGELLHDAGQLAQGGNLAGVRWLAPVNPKVEGALSNAGYALDWESSGYLYEKRHPGT
jgi:GNAT superfamily N-acetyltransferase